MVQVSSDSAEHALAHAVDEASTVDLAVLSGLEEEDRLKPYRITHFQPFDPVHKRTEATVSGRDEPIFQVSKGAPQVILELAANADEVAIILPDESPNVRCQSRVEDLQDPSGNELAVWAEK